MQEVWRDIIGYEGLYQVSNIGNVKTLYREYSPNGAKRFTEEKILKSSKHLGYLRVGLSCNGKFKTLLIHRLVALAFIPCVNNKLEVNHIDGDKSNNKINNLEWCNRNENLIHSFKNGLSKSRKLEEHKMAKIVLDLQTGVFYGCAKEAAKAKNINYSTLINKLSGWHNNNYTGLIYI